MVNIKKGKYKHYKGEFYEVIDLVRHSEDESLLVLYRPLYGEGLLWVRPYDMFIGQVQTQNGERKRFVYVSAS
ncbi:hypothetical protein GPUN_2116 [Glaciecola punicea ACAM 611]|jgi:hypothetical protein|uniref:DUF1653 domain-containing protein n=1 Tax=Glaciecola punicea ACAM 611 TaxID=1121923 RepID=H5TD54_9ALTE|nr:DUF1653 domain-containing protein [Glaciecola punicea]OFA30142.1 hypothetical protein BAE46_12255 [Glaciecola punicea]GAB56231.1 hypothetical protein GPUN_2116 [Glaciecola punicea ACAM 611]